MLKTKKYNTFDFILIPLKVIPFQTLFAIFINIINSLLPAYQTIVIANFINTAIDIFNNKSKYSQIVPTIIMIVCYFVFINLIPSISQVIELSGQNHLTEVLKKEIIVKQAKLEYKHMENPETLELINRINSSSIENFKSGLNNIYSAVNLLISTLSLLIIIMSSTFITGIIIVVISVPLIFISMRVGKKSYIMNMDANNLQRKYNYLAEILNNREYAEERKLFNYNNYIIDKYEAIYNESFKILSKIQIKSYAYAKSGSLVTLLIVMIIVGILLPTLNSGNISIGLFISLINAILNLVQNMSWKLSGVMREYTRLKEYLKEITAFVHLTEKIDSCSEKSKNISFKFKSLEFRDVSFKYPSTDKYILKNCSFKLRDKRNYAFVGINGAGKTTITKLITGLYDDYEGEILINDKNIKDYKYSEIKGMISIVYQDFARYSLSIKENIVIGDIAKNDEKKIEQVLSEMDLKDVVDEYEHKMETVLGKIKDGSKDISNGQWQRLAISRLLYADSEINILDEPTAALDPIAESKVYELFSKVNNSFKIFITHRLGAAKMADEILLIADGRIVEQGTHSSLLTIENGIYKTMFENQKSWYEPEKIII